jgi:hypothetical protein
MFWWEYLVVLLVWAVVNVIVLAFAKDAKGASTLTWDSAVISSICFLLLLLFAYKKLIAS